MKSGIVKFSLLFGGFFVAAQVAHAYDIIGCGDLGYCSGVDIQVCTEGETSAEAYVLTATAVGYNTASIEMAGYDPDLTMNPCSDPQVMALMNQVTPGDGESGGVPVYTTQNQPTCENGMNPPDCICPNTGTNITPCCQDPNEDPNNSCQCLSGYVWDGQECYIPPGVPAPPNPITGSGSGGGGGSVGGGTVGLAATVVPNVMKWYDLTIAEMTINGLKSGQTIGTIAWNILTAIRQGSGNNAFAQFANISANDEAAYSAVTAAVEKEVSLFSPILLMVDPCAMYTPGSTNWVLFGCAGSTIY